MRTAGRWTLNKSNVDLVRCVGIDSAIFSGDLGCGLTESLRGRDFESRISLERWVLWHHQTVQKPELILESKPEHNFLRARCSLCPRIRFNLVGNTLAEKALLRQMFDIHVREVHEHKK